MRRDNTCYDHTRERQRGIERGAKILLVLLIRSSPESEVSTQHYGLRLEVGQQILHRLEERWLRDTAKM